MDAIETNRNNMNDNDIGDDPFPTDYTDSITSIKSSKPLLKSSNGPLSPKFDNDSQACDKLWDVKEEDDEMLERRSILSGLLEKPAFMKAISCESLRSNILVAQACRSKSSLWLSADKGLNHIDSLPTIQITEVTAKVEQQNFRQRLAKNLYQIRNVIILSFGTMIAYSAFLAVRNLQSSLNTKGGLGLISLAVGYSMYMPGSILAPFIVKVLRPKPSIVIALSCQAVYVFMNLYPSFYTLLPSCLLVGLGNSLFWVSVSSYLVFSAKSCAETTKKVFDFVLSRFYGTFFLIYQLNNIPGNVLSSAILFSGVTHIVPNSSVAILANSSALFSNNATSNTSSATFASRAEIVNCGVSYSHGDIHTTHTVVADRLRYILIGSLGAIEVLGILMILLFVRPVKTYKAKVQLKVVKQEVKKMLGMFLDRRYCLIMPLLFYSGLQTAFMNGDMIKAFITCPLGIQMVGYLSMGFGLATSISSYMSGLLNKHVGRLAQVVADSSNKSSGFSVNIGLLIMMLVWRPTTASSLAPLALLFCLWGLADGVWNSQMNGLIGFVFADKAESANACFRLLQGFGVSMAYGYAQALDMEAKIYITGSLATVGVLGYCAMEFSLARDERSNSEKEQLPT